MKKEKNFIIIDTRTSKAIYGVKNKAMRFSTKEIAEEIAEQLFEKISECLIVNIVDDLHLS